MVSVEYIMRHPQCQHKKLNANMLNLSKVPGEKQTENEQALNERFKTYEESNEREIPRRHMNAQTTARSLRLDALRKSICKSQALSKIINIMCAQFA